MLNNMNLIGINLLMDNSSWATVLNGIMQENTLQSKNITI